jgi:hypothetical protein
MIKRGAMIEVINSTSLNKRAHPNVGDIGYISEAFFAWRKKFIVIGAFFFQYANDSEPCRVERKRLILDLGMSKETLRRLQARDLNRRDFQTSNTGEFISLTTCGYTIDNGGVFDYFLPHSNGGLWAKSWSSSARYITDAKSGGRRRPIKSRVPICEVKFYVRRYDIASKNSYQIRAWLAAMSHLMFTMTDLMVRMDVSTSEVNAKLISKCKALEAYAVIKEYNGVPKCELVISSRERIARAINDIQLLALYNRKFVESQELKLMRKMMNSKHLRTAKSYWHQHGPEELLKHGDNPRDVRHVPLWLTMGMTSLIFRAVLTSGNTYHAMQGIHNFIPTIIAESSKARREFCQDMDKMKMDLRESSSALNRVYDTRLMGMRKVVKVIKKGRPKKSRYKQLKGGGVGVVKVKKSNERR